MPWSLSRPALPRYPVSLGREFNAYTAPYANARLQAWLRRHPKREGAGAQTDIAGMGDLMVAMSGLDIDVQRGAGSSFGAELSGSQLPAELESGVHVLLADVLTQSPERIDRYAFREAEG